MFSLTQQEKTVLVCVACVFFIGTMFHFAMEKSPRFHHALSILESEKVYPKIDINTASYEEIVGLPFVGPVIARRIIDTRAQKGFFSDIEELKNIEGIGPSNFKKFSKFLRSIRTRPRKQDPKQGNAQ